MNLHHNLLVENQNIILLLLLQHLHIMTNLKHSHHLHSISETYLDFFSSASGLLQLNLPLKDHRLSYCHHCLYFSSSFSSFCPSFIFSSFFYFLYCHSHHHHMIINSRHLLESLTFNHCHHCLICHHLHHFLHCHRYLNHFFSFSCQPLILMFSFPIPL